MIQDHPAAAAFLARNPRVAALLEADPATWGPLIAERIGLHVQGLPRPAPRAWPAPARRVVIRTFLNDYSGFGRFGLWVGKGLESAGVPVAYEALSFDQEFRRVGDWQRARVEQGAPEDWRLQAHFMGHATRPDKATVYYTMHEASRIPADHAATLNGCRAVVVPCRWNAAGFAASGVAVPIHVVPAGVSPDEGFRPEPGRGASRLDGPFVVLVAGRTAMGGMRKGIGPALQTFRAAFAGLGPDRVRLKLKVWPDCKADEPGLDLDRVGDDRVEVERRPFTTGQMADWYRTGSVYLSLSKSEGWGLHTIESMACGVPPVIPIATGTADFVTPECAYPVEYAWAPARGYYQGHGDWAEPDVASAVAQLRRAEADRADVARRGALAADRAAEFTWEATGRALRSVLECAGMLKPRAALAEAIHLTRR